MEITLLTVLGSVFVGALAVGGVVFGNISSRLRAVEDDLSKERQYNRALWLWAKSVLDLYYKTRPAGSPEPPPMPKES